MGSETFRGSRGVCYFWMKGTCNRNPCRFVHAAPDLRNVYVRGPKQPCSLGLNKFRKDIHNGPKKSSVLAGRLHGVIEGEVLKKRTRTGFRVKSLKEGARGPLLVTDESGVATDATVVETLASSEVNPVQNCSDEGCVSWKSGSCQEGTKSSSRVKSLKGASCPLLVTDVRGVATDGPVVETLASSEESEQNPVQNCIDETCVSLKSGGCQEDGCKLSNPCFHGEGFSLLVNLEGHTEVITGIDLPSGSDKLYSGSYDGTVRVWDCHSGQTVTVINLGNKVGSLICVGLWVFVGIPNAVKAWNTETDASLTLDGPVGQVYSMIAALDMLFAGSQDGTIVVWKDCNEKPNPFKLAASLKGHTGSVTCLAIGDLKLYSGSLDCTIRIWDLQNLQCMRILNGHSEGVKSLILCNQYLLTCSLDRTIKIWAKDGSNVEAIHTHVEEHGVIALAGIEAKPILLCSLDDNSVRFYELPSFADKGKLFSKGEVETIQNGPLGLFFTGDGSGALSVWKTDQKADDCH